MPNAQLKPAGGSALRVWSAEDLEAAIRLQQHAAHIGLDEVQLQTIFRHGNLAWEPCQADL